MILDLSIIMDIGETVNGRACQAYMLDIGDIGDIWILVSIIYGYPILVSM